MIWYTSGWPLWLAALVYGLAVWRVAFLLVYDFGPWGVFYWLRSRFGVLHDEDDAPNSWPRGSVFSCLGCMSIWVAFVLAVVPVELLVPIAAAAVAKLVQRWYE